MKNKGLDWQWVTGSNSTDASCPGAQRLPFVQGYAPAYEPCSAALPNPEETTIDGQPVDPNAPDANGTTPSPDQNTPQPQMPDVPQRN